MILLLLLASVLLMMSAAETPRARWLIIQSAFVATTFYLLWMQEHLAGTIEFFISDEQYYVDSARDRNYSWVDVAGHGYLWIAVNRWVTEFDISLNGHALKLLNIPIVLMFTLVTYRVFDRDPRVLLVPLVLPYLLWLSIFNMRDLAVLLAAATVAYALFTEQRARPLLVMTGVIAMALLRPEFTLVLVIACGIALFRRDRSAVRWRQMAVWAVVVAIVIGPTLVERIQKRIVWMQFVHGVAYEEFSAGRASGYLTSTRAGDFAVSLARYTFAPTPPSLMVRIAEGGSELWGMVDDIVRVWHQIGYYCCLAIVAIRARRIPAYMAQLTTGQLALMLFLMAYMPIYSFHLFGVSHQRLKVPFQLAVSLLAIGLVRPAKRTVGPQSEPRGAISLSGVS